MSIAAQESPTLTHLSNDLADAIAFAARYTVAVDARSRPDASGIVWQPGVIITSSHAIDGDDDVLVTTAEGSTLKASLIGSDPTTDVAALAIDSSVECACAVAAEQGDLRVGSVALALGRSTDTGISASLGVVSALDGAWRTWRGGHIDCFIRPDVAFYPGFGGGPLIDTHGQLIGMNTGGLSRRIGVTVPTTTIKRIVEALQRTGRVARGYLGIGMQPIQLPQALQQSLGLASDGAVIAVAVEPGGPADRAGLFLGDVILQIDAERIDTVDDMQAALGPESVGKRVDVRILRGGQGVTVPVTIGERPRGEE